LHVFCGITYVNAVFGGQADAVECEIQRTGVWFFLLRITAAYPSAKGFSEAKFAELVEDAVAVSAGD
jgi:hypothetical protein